ncbi:MAG: hypothetical protein WCR02_05050, partial [Sphaerochaetaceae bacterium]
MIPLWFTHSEERTTSLETLPQYPSPYKETRFERLLPGLFALLSLTKYLPPSFLLRQDLHLFCSGTRG